jgi:hypothetical protein
VLEAASTARAVVKLYVRPDIGECDGLDDRISDHTSVIRICEIRTFIVEFT